MYKMVPKIMTCSNGGGRGKCINFYWYGEEIETVHTLNYLGYNSKENDEVEE